MFRMGWIATLIMLSISCPLYAQGKRWSPGTVTSVSSESETTAKVMPTGFVEFSGSTAWQDSTLSFRFDAEKTIRCVQLELLPNRSTEGRCLLFDVIASVEKPSQNADQLTFRRCWCPQAASDDTTQNCIDFLSDTGWEISHTKTDQPVVLQLQLERDVTVKASERFAIRLDSGGNRELTTLRGVRVSFSED